jgi:hypothetical protein
MNNHQIKIVSKKFGKRNSVNFAKEPINGKDYRLGNEVVKKGILYYETLQKDIKEIKSVGINNAFPNSFILLRIFSISLI